MTKEDLKQFNLPDGPGVYLFKKGRRILYIGKAASLRDRTRSYFAPDLAQSRSDAIVRMVEEADRVTYRTTDSVLEALFLEAGLIQRHLPPYNTLAKDNKSFNYLVVTKEAFPRVLVVRGRELHTGWTKGEVRKMYGPFPGGLALQDALKMVRRIFPYRDDKCAPCGTPKNRSCKPCFSRQIGLCPGVCTGEITAREYAQVVRNIREIFSGNFHGLRRRLTAQMQASAKAERYEEAAQLRRQVDALTHIRDVSLIKAPSRVSSGGWRISGESARIEAYDVAHTAGKGTVGVMTVVEDGVPLKSAYRKFTIRSTTNDDIGSLREVLGRRLAHPEWPLPKVVAVDGGKAQVSAARKVLREAGVLIPVVGVVKDESHRAKGLLGDPKAIAAHEKDILLGNSEAHRFAIAFHRRKRDSGFL